LVTGAAAGLAAEPAFGENAPRTAEMPRRVLGRTKESVTMLGLGCAYAGNGVPEAQTRVTLETALEGGIRYFDAAPDYEQAEVRLGPVVKPVRDKLFLVTKSYALDAKEAEKDLHTSLKRLQTDHVDLFLQHGVGIKPPAETQQLLGKGGSLEFFRKAKKNGLTRFIGMSVHSPHAITLQLLEKSDEWDVIQPFINYVTAAREKLLAQNGVDVNAASDYEKLFDKACEKKLGIVAMKVMGGAPGPLVDDYDRAFRYALSVPGVTVALVGAANANQVKRAVQAARQFRPFTEAEMDECLRKGEHLVRTKSSKALMLERHLSRDFGSTRCA
jgi:aryl-alcohol dehydrogenase-like predicted oxidoreductase